MGKRSPDANTYESVDGFVEDAPKTKKPKIERKKNETKSSTQLSSGGPKSKDGNAFWEISNNRRIGISEFKGKTMIDIREYYEKDGEMLPGKKGISLTLEQYNTVMGLLPQIDSALAAKGVKVEKPDYGGSTAKVEHDDEEDEEVDDKDNDSDE